MKEVLWCAVCFLVLHAESSGAVNIATVRGLFNQNVSFADMARLLIPTLDAASEKCREDSEFYFRELKNFKLWATEMFDSSTKFPSGILYGSSYDLGNFDQCIEVKVPRKGEDLKGKYCLAKFIVNPPKHVAVSHRHIDYEYDDYRKYYNISSWEKIVTFSKDDSKAARNEAYVTFCVPSSCSANDLSTSLHELINDLNNINDFNVTLDLKEDNCQVKEEIYFTTADIIFLTILVFFALTVLLSSIYDLMTRLDDLKLYKVPSILHRVLLCFSFPKNLKKLATKSKNEDGLACIAGLKVLSMFLIIMGHRCMFTFGAPLKNPKFIEQMYARLEATVILNGPIIVDTFFFLSGFLATYLIMAYFEKNKLRSSVFLIYVHRLFRMFPAYAMVLAFYCTLFVKTGNGPFWNERVAVEQERCIESWWANLLYINNYVNVDKMCMFQSWYLTCDMHYFLFVPLLAWLLHKKPFLGLLSVTSIICLSIFAVFAVVYIDNEDGILLLYMKLLRDPVLNRSFKNVYIPSHLRASPYFVGVIIGWIKYKMQVTGYKISKHLVYVGWAVCIFIFLITVYSAFIFYIPHVPRNTLFSAIYASMHHFTFSLCIGWIIIAVTSGNGSWIEPFLSWRPFVPLSRITYTAFLSHGAVQIYSAAILRSPKYAEIFPTLYDACGDAVLAYIFGFVLSMHFEAPLIGLEKIIFGRREKEQVSNYDKTLREFAITTIPKIETIGK